MNTLRPWGIGARPQFGVHDTLEVKTQGWGTLVAKNFAPHETFYGHWLNYHQFLLCAQAVDFICCHFLDKYREEILCQVS